MLPPLSISKLTEKAVEIFQSSFENLISILCGMTTTFPDNDYLILLHESWRGLESQEPNSNKLQIALM